MDYILVRDDETAVAAAANLSRSHVIAFDLETQGLDPYTDAILLLIFKGEREDDPIYLLPGKDIGEYPQMWDIFRDKILLAHNAAFEYMFMRQHGYWHYPKGYFCTALAQKVLTAGYVIQQNDYGSTVKMHCNVTLDKSLQKSWVGMGLDEEPTPEQYEYALNDVKYLHAIMRAQLRRANREGLMRVMRLEQRVMPAFAEMRLNGFYLNAEKHAEVVRRYAKAEANARVEVEMALGPLYETWLATENQERAAQWAELDEEIRVVLDVNGVKQLRKDAPPSLRERVLELRKLRNRVKPKPIEPINIASADQVLAALKVAGIEPVMLQPDGTVKPSLDQNVLREWQHEPLIRLYKTWSKPNKVVSTYGESLAAKRNPKTGRIHSDYNQMVNSGRTSSKEPNGQNMPKDVRACFEAEEGYTLVVADAANQEGRLAAALSGDADLLAVFLEGKDWHCLTAAAAWPELFPGGWTEVPKDSDNPLAIYRARAKNANFSSIYGGTGYTLWQRGYVDDKATGDKIMEAVYAAFPTLREWSLHTADLAVSDGVALTISGRKRYFKLDRKPPYGDEEGFQKWKRQRGGIRRAAMNHPVQGSGADVMKQAMIFLLPYMRRIGGKQVGMVHDELVYEVPLTHAEEAASMVAQQMERAAACFITQLPIPADVHVTKEWKK